MFSPRTITRSVFQFRGDIFINDDPTIVEELTTSLGNLANSSTFQQLTGWYMDRAQVNPNYSATGTPSVPLTGSGTEVDVIGEGVRVSVAYSNSTSGVASTEKFHCRYAVTVLYFGKDGVAYQEKDLS